MLSRHDWRVGRKVNDLKTVYETGAQRRREAPPHQLGHSLAKGDVSAFCVNLHFAQNIIIERKSRPHTQNDAAEAMMMSRRVAKHHVLSFDAVMARLTRSPALVEVDAIGVAWRAGDHQKFDG